MYNTFMYKVLVEVKKSSIDGKGVFAKQNIAQGSIVWIFKENHDIKLTQAQKEKLSADDKLYLAKAGYLSPWSGFWVMPPKGDLAEYTNHSSNNNLSVKFDKSVSSEPYFIANKDIGIGEEITNNYNEFDQITRSTKPVWAR
jgi:SET domain-containing protein